MDFTTYEPRISALEAGGGGGGSSDFSTATITIIGGENAIIYCANYYNDAENPEYSMSYGRLETGENQVILYKGKASLETSANVSTTGNIEFVGGNTYIVSGDCTITVS